MFQLSTRICNIMKAIFLYSLFWVIPRRQILLCRRFGTLFFSIFICGISKNSLSAYTRQYSEMSAHKIQTPGNHPKERIQQLEPGESVKSRRLYW
jgi:hypothetical protein